MFKLKSLNKEQITKLLTVLLIAFVAVFSLLTITGGSGNHNKVVSDDREMTLCRILSDINGVGEVSVMIEYGRDDSVVGVIVTAEGAEKATVKEQLIKGVASLFNISSSNVSIYEKQKGDMNENN